MNIPWVFLSAIFALKHFVADFPCQNDYMVVGKGKVHGWILPLMAHCTVHACFTLCICLAFRPQLFWLAVVDFVIHFLMDRVKASPRLLGRFKLLAASEFAQASEKQKQDNELFWSSLGFDQMIHNLTNLLLVYLLVTL